LNEKIEDLDVVKTGIKHHSILMSILVYVLMGRCYVKLSTKLDITQSLVILWSVTTSYGGIETLD